MLYMSYVVRLQVYVPQSRRCIHLSGKTQIIQCNIPTKQCKLNIHPIRLRACVTSSAYVRYYTVRCPDTLRQYSVTYYACTRAVSHRGVNAHGMYTDMLYHQCFFQAMMFCTSVHVLTYPGKVCTCIRVRVYAMHNICLQGIPCKTHNVPQRITRVKHNIHTPDAGVVYVQCTCTPFRDVVLYPV